MHRPTLLMDFRECKDLKEIRQGSKGKNRVRVGEVRGGSYPAYSPGLVALQTLLPLAP